MREKLIDLVESVLRCLPWGEISSHTAENIADRIMESELFENLEQFKWIPVTERLPEDIGYVIISRLWWRPQVGWYINDSGEWVDFDGTVLHNVTHWMPLPEPPKEEE